MLTKNQSISLTITAISNDGNGIGRFDGQAVFVPFTAIGDVLTVKIVKACKSYAFGIVEAILTPGEGRMTPACALFGKCGGCCFAHLTYEAELQAKESFVRDALCHIGGITAPVSPIWGAPSDTRYRNKVQYPVFNDENGIMRAGFFAGRSHRVIPCDDCLLQPVLLNQITAAICRILTQLGVPAYKESTHTGLVRHIYLRHAADTNTVMVCLIVNGKKLPYAEEFCADLLQEFPQITTILLNVNREKTNVITGKKSLVLYGDGVLHDTLSNVPVALDPLSFYQVNTAGANLLYSVIARLAQLKSTDILLDLYCGAGTIGLSMAQNCAKLIGVEIVAEAVESAKQNAAAMGVTHAEFLCADAGKAAEKFAKDGLAPDVIVLDPPRKGCDNATLEAVIKMAPARVVMVSCNPATAARDLQILQKNGYQINTVQPVDMFPRTRHVECVVLMSRVSK
ncbi:MAG: 23S rRNA (uracil(1939)-C(5))-methyltransferase RlmD [Ruthenibacterium sp.]